MHLHGVKVEVFASPPILRQVQGEGGNLGQLLAGGGTASMLSALAILRTQMPSLTSACEAVEYVNRTLGLRLFGLQLRKLAFSPGSLNVFAVQP